MDTYRFIDSHGLKVMETNVLETATLLDSFAFTLPMKSKIEPLKKRLI